MDQDLIDLIAACKGEDPGPARRDELLTRLRRDPEFQQAFVDEIRMLGMLKAVQSTEPRWLRLQDRVGWGRSPAAGGADGGDGGDEFMRRVGDALPRPASAARELWSAAAGVALLVAALALLFWPRGRVAAPALARPYPKVGVESGLAMVVKLEGVSWEGRDEPHPAEGDVVAPGRLRFRSGRATLFMLSGVVLAVEGPADLELISVDRVFCRQGRLRTRVPKEADGFIVSSPESSVIDLGTEIGLNIEGGGRSRVKVFEGKAEAFIHPGARDQNFSQFLDGRKVFEIDPAAGRITAVEGPGSFINGSNLPRPSLVLDPSYPAEVLASHPWGYWRFESARGRSTPNEVTGRPPLVATGPVRLVGGPAGGNHAAVFRAGGDVQYLAMDGFWEPTPSPGYAVELWFLPEAIDHASLVSMPAPRDTNNHFFFLETTSRNRHALHPPASVRLLDRWPPALGGGYNVYSGSPYVPYRWHHLVGQMNGGRMELYLDGEPTYSRPDDLGHPTVPCQFLVGRLSTVPVNDAFYGRAFAGRIDEVAVYNRPLSAAEIERHRRLAVQRFPDRRSPPARPPLNPPAGGDPGPRTGAGRS